MEVTDTIYDVAREGVVAASFSTREQADAHVAADGGQIRVRAEKRKVPAAFAVYVDGSQVGDAYTDPGAAAKAAKAAGGMIRMVPAE